ncbi:MAG: inositol monophosphatase [Planctomycetaceae bacterium]|nr:inositol monophosphatase [Planctomycetaceae bacterium]
MADRDRWQEYLPPAIEAAKQAGQVLLDWREKFSVTEKGRSDLVTEADFEAQETIYQILHTAFPKHGYLGEEGLEQAGEDPDFRWVIDPLDGTGNYVHGFPYYCVSIGLEYKGRIVAAVIYDPTRDDVFQASLGAGAFLNSKPIQVSKTEKLSHAMCIASLPVAGDVTHPAINRFLAVLPRAQTVQRHGSAAMNLANLACGRADVFWSSTLKPWDMAAGVLIVQEAGGLVTTLDGSEYDIYHGEILATCSPNVQKEIIPLVCPAE